MVLIYSCLYEGLIPLIKRRFGEGFDLRNFEDPSVFRSTFEDAVYKGETPDCIITGSQVVGTSWDRRRLPHATQLVTLGALNKVPLVIIYTAVPGQYKDIEKAFAKQERTRVIVIPKVADSGATNRMIQLLSEMR